VKKLWIVVTVLLVGVVVVGSITYWLLSSTVTTSGGPTCGFSCGSALAIGVPEESTAGGTHFYNFSVQSASGGLTWGNTELGLQTSDGGPISVAGSGWNFTIQGPHHESLAAFANASGNPAWTFGGTTTVSIQQVIVLTSPIQLSGDEFMILGTGTFSGSVSVSIP